MAVTSKNFTPLITNGKYRYIAINSNNASKQSVHQESFEFHNSVFLHSYYPISFKNNPNTASKRKMLNQEIKDDYLRALADRSISTDIKNTILDAVVKDGSSTDTDIAKKLINDRNPEIRERVYDAIGQIGDLKDLADLKKALSRELRDLPKEDPLDEAEDVTETEENVTSPALIAVCHSIQQIIEHSEKKEIETLITDENLVIANYAAFALREKGDPDSINKLKQLLDKQPEKASSDTDRLVTRRNLQRTTLATIVEIMKKHKDSTRFVQFRSDKNIAVRKAYTLVKTQDQIPREDLDSLLEEFDN